jgi:hypothetical protein
MSQRIDSKVIIPFREALVRQPIDRIDPCASGPASRELSGASGGLVRIASVLECDPVLYLQ